MRTSPALMPRPRIKGRRLLLGVLALITPAGLILVNIAAYVMAHLVAFRVAITVGAVVSTLVLNGITAVAGYRLAAQRWPDARILAERYRRAIAASGLFLLVMAAAITGELTYAGLRDPKNLPNLQTFLGGLIGLLIPLAVAVLYGEDVSPRARRRYRTR